MRPEDERYFEGIEDDLDSAFEVAEAAKRRGGDPEPEVEIPVAVDMAARVENILGIDGVAERVRELEEEMGREEAALALVEDFVEGAVGDYETRAGKVEGAVRTAVALLTEGVVAAPIEGIDRVELLENDDGTEFVNVYYAGPIRSAGGTAQALSVLVGDYARALLGIDEYRARSDEVERYAEEVSLYDSETGLQYTPKDKETKFIAEHMPVMLDGEATGDEEVTGFRDLERVDTNNARGGMCLVLAEGIALKAPKIQRYTRQLEEVSWPWLQDLIDGTYDDSADEGEEDEADADGEDGEGTDDESVPEPDGPPRVEPAAKYLRDLIAGRPVFGHPSEEGGFRLRYGRARNHGFATAGVHPATMHLVDDFLATGTQIKTERPGKAAGVVPVDSIEGPTVKLANGDVRRVDDPEEALEIRNGVVDILDLGEYLVNYGEFVENNHPLAPASYVQEWWEQDLQASDADGVDLQALRDSPYIDPSDPDAEEALEWTADAPLHPKYTYCWHDITVEQFETLADAVAAGSVVSARADGGATGADEGTADANAPDGSEPGADGGATGVDTPGADGGATGVDTPGADDGATGVDTPGADDGATGVDTPAGDTVLVLPNDAAVRDALESLLVEHSQGEDAVRVGDWKPFVRSLGFTTGLEREWGALSDEAAAWPDAMKAVNEVAPFEVRERAPTRIGSRMGRPEKSESRDLSPAVHTLFPIGEAGGSQRDVAAASTHAEGMSDTPGELSVDVGERVCPDCATHTFRAACPDCGASTDPYFECADCGIECAPDESGRVECPRCERVVSNVRPHTVDLHGEYRDALTSVGERESAFEILKGVKGLTSAEKVPEPIEKGVLRAKHGVSTFKDGTVRYDMTDLPVTAVRPSELDVEPEQLRALGYEEDVRGDPLRHDDQLVHLKVQDVVLSDGAAEHMLKTADFVDDLLESYYGLDSFYDCEERDDLVGELVFGMAPHTSAAVVGRVVGFTSAAVGYAHPYFHAAKRRNCFHPDTKLWYRDEGETWHHERVETFVEARLDPETAETDDFGTLVEELDGDVRVPSIAEDGEEVLKPVEAVSKHRAPEHMVRVETRSGREITVTPDHRLCRWDDGIEKTEASELKTGDTLSLPSGRDYGGGTTPTATAVDGGRTTDTVAEVEILPSDTESTYCLTVSDTHTLVADGLHADQCDGDEDCVMLLMDGLLNFSRSYLPDQRGGSVAEDSRLVAVGPDGEVRFTTFDEFWDELDSSVERDGKFRKKTCFEEGWRTYAFDDDHESSLKPIEKAIRYRAEEDESLVQVETQFGRSLELTEHHSLFRYDDGIEEVAGADLEPGDLVVAPQSFDIETTERTIDALEAVGDPYVFIDDEVEAYLNRVWDAASRGDDTRVAFDGGISYRLGKRKLSAETLDDIAVESGIESPQNPRVGLKGSSTGVDRFIDIDERFGWLLGLFTAEGSLSTTRPTIHNTDEEIVEQAVDAAVESLGVEPNVRWSNKSYEIGFPAVVRELLYDLGYEDAESYNSSEKIVPECILHASDETALAFLRGFIAGDGSESSDDNYSSVRFHTTSEAVKDGVLFLLHRFGIVGNISRRERDTSRQPIYSVSVSGGATDNPLRRLLDGKEPYEPKSLVVTIPEELMAIREMDIQGVKQTVPKYLKRRENVSLAKLREMVDELEGKDLPNEAHAKLDEIRPLLDGDLSYLRVKSVERTDYDGYLYDLQVGGDPVFTAGWLYAHNSMDAPLVMSSRIDPSEIDDEAHNMDIVERYPKSFYEATREMADPEEVDVEIAEATLDTEAQYAGFEHTHDTSDIALGPDLSAYKTLGSMTEKMDAQLELARKLRAVDESDVAERIIEGHFLPDLIGNLRAFSRQETRCLDCGEKYRRMPLTGECRECGGDVNLTVHQGSVNKYMETAITVAEEFDCREYTKQRLEILERRLNRIFENDKNKSSTLGDFM